MSEHYFLCGHCGMRIEFKVAEQGLGHGGVPDPWPPLARQLQANYPVSQFPPQPSFPEDRRWQNFWCIV